MFHYQVIHSLKYLFNGMRLKFKCQVILISRDQCVITDVKFAHLEMGNA